MGVHGLSSTDCLSLASRRRIFEHVRERPGTHLREIARSLEAPLGTVLYHLDCLVEGGLVAARRDGRYKRFFAVDGLGRRERDYVTVLRHSVPRGILAALVSGAPGTQRKLAERLRVSRSTLSFHVNALVDRGILAREDAWPENQYRLAEPDLAERMLRLAQETATSTLALGLEESSVWGVNA